MATGRYGWLPSSWDEDTTASSFARAFFNAATPAETTGITYDTGGEMGENGLKVYKMGDGVRNWDKLHPVIRMFANSINKNVCVTNAGLEATDPNQDTETFHIRFCSNATGGIRQAGGITTAYGYLLASGQRGGLQPSNLLPVIKDQHGTSLAEVDENTLYILFDLPHTDFDDTPIILEKILRDSLGLICNPTEFVMAIAAYDEAKKEQNAKEDLLRKKLEKKEAALRKKMALNSSAKYVELCRECQLKHVANAKKSVAQYADAIEQAQIRLTELVREQKGWLADLNHRGDDLELSTKEYALEFEKLAEIPGVETALVDGECLEIYTKNITLPFKDKTYDIGKFKIVINMRLGSVKGRNLTRQIKKPSAPDANSYNHPFINAGGDCCFGNIVDSVNKLFGEYQYGIAVNIIMQWLESYDDTGGPFCPVERWPLVEEN